MLFFLAFMSLRHNARVLMVFLKCLFSFYFRQRHRKSRNIFRVYQRKGGQVRPHFSSLFLSLFFSFLLSFSLLKKTHFLPSLKLAIPVQKEKEQRENCTVQLIYTFFFLSSSVFLIHSLFFYKSLLFILAFF